MAKQRNLVFIMSDQQRYDTLGCYGNDWIDVPNLNSMAARSFVFENAYVTQPVCTPARASIMTGLYPHAAGPIVNKLHLPHDIPTIAEMVSPDYARGYFGKWHLGDDIVAQHGFDTWVSSEDTHRENYSAPEHLDIFSDYHKHLISNGFQPDIEKAGAMVFSTNARAKLPEEFQMASFLGDKAVEYIEENKERPFIMYVSTFEPHSPYLGPLMDNYDPAELPVGPAFLKEPDGASLVNRVRSNYFLQYLRQGGDQTKDSYMRDYAATEEDVSTEIGWRRLRAHYFANITLVDRMVGKITDALDRSGIADETVVIFTSEHGDMLGDHGMLEKRSLYEESSRVPLLIQVPWISDKENLIRGSVGQIDLLPTILDLLGEPIQQTLQGKSLGPVLRGEKQLNLNDVFIEWNGTSDTLDDRDLGSPAINRMLTLPWRSIVSERWKLNLCVGDQCELFNLNSDPYEMNNLFDDPARRDLVRDLAARIRLWQKETGDNAPLPTV